MRLRGAKSLVTGATSGIGRATALLLAEEGASLFLTGRHGGRLRDVEGGVRARGAEALSLALDLETEGAPEFLVAEAVQAMGGLDLLVNNAGVGLSGPVAGIRPEDLARAFRLNVLVPQILVREAYPHLKARGGTVVNVASLVAFFPVPRLGGYAATKAALSFLSRSLRMEAKDDGIRVVTLHPGLTATGLFENPLGRPRSGGHRPPRQAAPPEQVALALVRALRGRTREVFVTPFGAFLALVAGTMPGVVEGILTRRAGRSP